MLLETVVKLSVILYSSSLQAKRVRVVFDNFY